MGALNRSTLAARAILERNASEPMDEAVEMAKAGSPIALKLCLERLVPVPQDRAITLPLPTNKSQPGEVFATLSRAPRGCSGPYYPGRGPPRQHDRGIPPPVMGIHRTGRTDDRTGIARGGNEETIAVQKRYIERIHSNALQIVVLSHAARYP